MTAPWALGTNSGDAMRKALQAFIKQWLADPKYKTRLPRQHLSILLPGEREGAGIHIRITSGPDQKIPWPYKQDGKQVVEDWHQINLTIKADKKAGGAESVSAVHGALRALFTNRFETPERSALESAGVHMCYETPDGLAVDPGNDSDEGTYFSQQISLRANSDTLLN